MSNRCKYEIPLYRGSLLVIHTEDLKSIEAEFDLEDTTEMDGFVFEQKDRNENPLYVVVFKGKPSPGVIAHESLHIVSAIYRDVHADFCLHNEEPQCYLLEWIVDQIHKTIKK